MNTPSAPLYAAIDLGSNSFHMLIARKVAGGIQTLTRIKRKVRLAAGLDHNNMLSDEAMQRGWQCLRLFSEHLRDIPTAQVRIAATATLRLASNAQQFVRTAEDILAFPINIISGEEEARLIYQGVSYTTGGADQRLVVDIGGGSTEIAAGKNIKPEILHSFPMGCVTWLERYFVDNKLSLENFTQAEQAAHELLKPRVDHFRRYGWQICVGASGTVQALQDIMLAQGMDEHITLDKLKSLRQRAIECGDLDILEIDGLTIDRALVFPSGLAILIAIFEALQIETMTLSGGALREGLIYSMLGFSVEQDICQRTISNIQQRYLLDAEQAQRVNQLAQNFAAQLATPWLLDLYCRKLLKWACQLHEIGLSVNFKLANQHAAYLIRHLELPGVTPSQQKLLAILLLNQSGPIDINAFNQQNAIPADRAHYLCRILRLAIIFHRRRSHKPLSAFHLRAENEGLSLILPHGWLAAHPLRADCLRQEKLWQSYVGWSVCILEKNS